MTRAIDQKFYIKVHSLFRSWGYLIFIFPFFFGLLQEVLGLPGVIKYVVDVAWMLLLLGTCLQRKIYIRSSLLPFVVWVFAFFFYTLVVYCFRFQSVFYYLWGLRNYLRFYIAFFAFSAVFTEEDAKNCMKFMDRLFYLNLFVCIFQFLQGHSQDYIGGIFGATKGCNGYLVIYLSVTVCKSVLEYMNGRETTVQCFLKSASALFIGAIAELKFFYIVFIVILMMAYLLTSFSVKKIFFLMTAAILVSVAAAVLGSLYSYFQGFLSLEGLLKAVTMKNYASSTDMGRFNAISYISDRFLTDFPSQLFGMGLGNCDTGAISLVTTDFHTRYVDLHFSIFSYAFMFIENGYIGLVMYVAFFIMCGLAARKRMKGAGNKLFCQMGIIGSAICLGLLLYNSSLRTEAGYMMYFVLALPFISKKKEIGSDEAMPASYKEDRTL